MFDTTCLNRNIRFDRPDAHIYTPQVLPSEQICASSHCARETRFSVNWEFGQILHKIESVLIRKAGLGGGLVMFVKKPTSPSFR
jgi:hypothetical protein